VLLCLLALASVPALAQTTTPQQPAAIPDSVPKPKPIILKPPPPKTAPAATGPQAAPTPAVAKTAPAAATPAKATSTTPTTILTKSFPVSAAGATGATAPKPKPTAPAAATTTPAPAVAPTPTPTPPPAPAFNRTVIFLDPAHGGVDSGSRIGDTILEKDVALALAFKLRSLLQARGFTVLLTRDNDTPVEPNNPASPLTLDDRAGAANHARAAACLLLHATGSGTGVHLYSSELDATEGEPAVQPWLTAQAAWVPQSQKLEKQLATALTRAHIPLVSSAASVRPVDSLTCPALVVEIAPSDDGDPNTINDSTYQQHVAEAIAASLVFWQSQVQPPTRLAASSAGSAAPTGTEAKQ